MSEKKLIDYIRYYIGADCWVQGQDEEKPIKLTGLSWDDLTGEWWCYFENTETSYALIQDVAPILIKLEDMTEEDKKQITYDGYKMLRNEQEDRVLPAKIQSCMWVARQTHYMLSKGYDLWNLIESGLAIDRKTLQS